MEEPKDKRTKAYKKWKADQEVKLKGLGDVIEDITTATGIKAVVDKIADGRDCGCDERKKGLNKFSAKILEMFTVRRPPVRCFTDEQREVYAEFMRTRTLNRWNDKDINMLIELYAHLFAVQYQAKDLCRNCASSGKILFRITTEIDKLYNA